MERKLFEVRYYDTYYIANIVHGVASDPFSYLLDLEGLYCDDRYEDFLIPFPKYSAFHRFIGFIIDAFFHRQITEIELEEVRSEEKRFADISEATGDFRRLFINDAFNRHKKQHESFEEWLSEQEKTWEDADGDDLSDYYLDLRLCGPLDELIEEITEEVFFIMFPNRAVLQAFNEFMSCVISRRTIEETSEEHRRFFLKDGVLKRVTIPTWVEKAVALRDRGLCNFCHRDVSGQLNIGNRNNFDHIVPLAEGGLNDVSNIQLLCDLCNLNKGQKLVAPSEFYERWYPIGE